VPVIIKERMAMSLVPQWPPLATLEQSLPVILASRGGGSSNACA